MTCYVTREGLFASEKAKAAADRLKMTELKKEARNNNNILSLQSKK